jgi:DNA-binding PadR family transcriptional regulator
MDSTSNKTPPLSSATLHILLALAGGDLHGYGIIKEVTRQSEGHYRMGPGTLYDNLKKLMDAGLVADAFKPASPNEEERRTYSLTLDGHSTLSAEIDRLQNVVKEARLRLHERKPRRA